jgi:hypothetical protein
MKKLVVLLFTVAFVKMNAQFIRAGLYTSSDYFHDVAPDSLYQLSGSGMLTKSIDINGDGTVDFDMVVYKGGGMGNPGGETYILPKTNSQVVTSGTASCSWTAAATPSAGVAVGELATAYQSGDTIKNSLNWDNTSTNITYRYWCSITNFDPSVSKYLGVRIFVANDTLYGWIKIKALNNCCFGAIGFTLEEFACNANSSIGIKDINRNDIKVSVYPNPATQLIRLKTSGINQTENSRIEVVNALGQMVIHSQYKNSLDIAGLQPGCYFIKIITFEKEVHYAKFVKE